MSSKFTTLIHVPGHPVQYAVPGKSVTEVGKELEAAFLAKEGYALYDMDESLKGVSLYLPSWFLDKIALVTRVDLEDMHKRQADAEAKAKISVVN